MKKIITTIAIIALMIVGMIQIDKYRVKSITHGEEGKAAIEKNVDGARRKSSNTRR